MQTAETPYVFNKPRPTGSRRVLLLLFRILLGLMTLFKGIQFIRNTVLVKQVILETDWLSRFTILQFIIPWIHLIGGFFILIGLYTRIAIVIQIPLAVGAILALYTGDSSLYGTEMAFAVLMLALLTLYLVVGDGFYSWKKWIGREKGLV